MNIFYQGKNIQLGILTKDNAVIFRLTMNKSFEIMKPGYSDQYMEVSDQETIIAEWHIVADEDRLKLYNIPSCHTHGLVKLDREQENTYMGHTKLYFTFMFAEKWGKYRGIFRDLTSKYTGGWNHSRIVSCSQCLQFDTKIFEGQLSSNVLSEEVAKVLKSLSLKESQTFLENLDGMIGCLEKSFQLKEERTEFVKDQFLDINTILSAIGGSK